MGDEFNPEDLIEKLEELDAEDLEFNEIESLATEFASDYVDAEKYNESVKDTVRGYSRESVLNWLTATSLAQGNEEYFPRFVYLKYLVYCFDSDVFGSENFEGEKVLELLELFNDDRWQLVEDVKAFRNDKKNRFGFENKVYNFIGSEIQSPERTLEEIASRFVPLNEKTDTFGFSIREELLKLLRYHTKLVQFLDESDLRKNNGYFLPDQEFVDQFCKLWQDYPDFKSSLGEPVVCEDEPDSYDQAREFFAENPNVEGVLLTPNIHIESLSRDIIEILRSNQDEIGSILEDQVKRESISQLTRLIPRQGLFIDFKIDGKHYDFGFMIDNQLVLGRTIGETFDESEHTRKVEEALDEFEATESFLEQENKVEIQGVRIQEKLKPLLMVVSDDIDLKMSQLEERDFCFSLLSLRRLKYLVDRMREERTSILFLIKLIREGQKTGSAQAGEMNFFEKAFTFESTEFDLEDSWTKVRNAPFVWSDKERQMFREERPLIDLRPSFVDDPFVFRVEEAGECIYRGHTGEGGTRFYCLLDQPTIFVLWEEKMPEASSSMDNILGPFSNMLIEVLADAIDNLDIESEQEFEIYVDTKQTARERGVLPDDFPENSPAGIAKLQDENSFHIAIDAKKVGMHFEEQGYQTMFYLVENIISELSQDIEEEDIRGVFDREKISEYTMGSVPYGGEIFHSAFHTPTIYDYLEVEARILEEFQEDIETGKYKGEEARDILLDIYNFLRDELIDEISDYSLRSIVELGYIQLEGTHNARKKLRASLAGFIGDERDEAREMFQKHENEISKHSMASRYIVEEAVFSDVDGKEDIGVLTWQRIVAIATRMIRIASLRDQIFSLSDYMEIAVLVNMDDGLGIRTLVENPAGDRYARSQSKHIQSTDLGEMFEDVSLEDKELDIDSVREILVEDELVEVSKAFKEALGFNLSEYIVIFTRISHLRQYLDHSGLFSAKYKELVDVLDGETEIDRKTIRKIIDFFTLTFDWEEDKEILETWKVEGRERLFISPWLR